MRKRWSHGLLTYSTGAHALCYGGYACCSTVVRQYRQWLSSATTAENASLPLRPLTVLCSDRAILMILLRPVDVVGERLSRDGWTERCGICLALFQNMIAPVLTAVSLAGIPRNDSALFLDAHISAFCTCHSSFPTAICICTATSLPQRKLTLHSILFSTL